MKIVIDIPEEIYKEAIKSGYSHLYDEDVANAVANGTPLPKGHSDLIDRTELLKAMDTWPKFGLTIDGRFVPCKANVHLIPYVQYADMVQAVEGMPAIIEADKENENESAD